MTDTSSANQSLVLSDFPVTRRWKSVHLDRIQVYSFGTPNGVKIPIALEEMGLEYEFHRVSLDENGVKTLEYLELNPNNKIPAIIDPNGPDGCALSIFESAAILIYLADKSGNFAGSNKIQRYEVLQWLMFQIGSVGPMFGQFGYFHISDGKAIDDPRPRERYLNEVKRLLNVVDLQLKNKKWIAGEYSIADIAIGPWLETISRFYQAQDVTGYESFTKVVEYVNRFKSRPAVVRGWSVVLESK